jgi:hypothetical protein
VHLNARELVAAGVLVQRELISSSALISAARDRGIAPLSNEVLEGWDQSGTFSPIAFVRGSWSSWYTTAPYPTDGIEFRFETEFRPWTEYAFVEYGHPTTRPLYSPWQLLYLPIAREASTVEVPAETLLQGPEATADWVVNSTEYIKIASAPYGQLEAGWAPMIRLLLRLQARYWPYVHGRTTLLFNAETHEDVDPLDAEYKSTTATDIAEQSGVNAEELRALHSWFCRRARGIDPAAHLYDLLRLQRRKDIERDRGARLQALDLYDAAEVLRRFHAELTGSLLPDADQLERETREEPRPLARTSAAPHRLHVIAEGAVEVQIVRRLFEAFTHQGWERAGLRITDLGGDKLEGSRSMIEGFGVYAQHVALLLDDENDAQRITRQFQRSGLAPSLHVTLAEPSFEEENFTDDELVSFAQAVAQRRGDQLLLSGQQLRQAHERRNRGRKAPKGLASVLEELSRAPEHGPAPVKKTELADEMAEFLLQEIRDAPGGHDEVAARRPIVHWVMSHPVQAARR